MDEWEERGLRVFLDGAFWWADPDQLSPCLPDWFGSEHRFIPFARSAWGDLWLWDGAAIHLLLVHRGLLFVMGAQVERYLEVALPDQDGRMHILREPLLAEAAARLGPLRPDEIFAFEPALVLGGSEEVGSVVKVKLAEHESFLAQLLAPVTVVPAPA